MTKKAKAILVLAVDAVVVSGIAYMTGGWGSFAAFWFAVAFVSLFVALIRYTVWAIYTLTN